MDETVWIPMECKDLEGEVLYYHRKLGNQTYAAHVFLVQYDSPEKLKNNWERLNEEIAGCYQGDVDSLLERSNFYLCIFLVGALELTEREKIENDAYCAKKYIFAGEEKLSLEEKLEKIDEKIFSLRELKNDDGSETKLLSMEVQNFRVYKGRKKFAFTAEREVQVPASLVMIYAPNGMGKTSVCDAIEWSLTGSIQRLSDMEKLIGKGGMLLHNRETYKKVEDYRANNEFAFVELELQNRLGTQAILKRTVKRSTNDLAAGRLKVTVDEKPDEKENPFKNERHWNRIIMPHDQIEKFVSAIQPAERYQEWMECVDPSGALSKRYERRCAEYVKAQKRCKIAEAELEQLKRNHEKLKWVEDTCKQLIRSVQNYNATAPDPMRLKLSGEKMSIEELGKILEEAKICRGTIGKELGALQKKQEVLDRYLLPEDNSYAKLREELTKATDNYLQCKKKLDAYIGCAKLRGELENEHAVCKNLKQELGLLKYIRQHGGAEMVRKNQKFITAKEQLIKQEKTLIQLFQEQAEISCMRIELSKQMEQLELEEKQREERAKKLLDFAKKAEMLRAQKMEQEFALRQQKTAVEKAKRKRNEQQKKREKIVKYVLPTQLEDYEEHPIPNDHPLFHYARKINELTELWERNRSHRTAHHEELKKAQELKWQLEQIAKEGKTFLEQHRKQCECPLCHTRFESWDMLYAATLRLEDSQQKQLQEASRRISEETKILARSSKEIREEWMRERNGVITDVNNACDQCTKDVQEAERYKEDIEQYLEKLEHEEQDTQLNAAQQGWNLNQQLTVLLVEETLPGQKTESLNQRIKLSAQEDALQQRQEELQAKKRKSEAVRAKLEKYMETIPNDPLWEKGIAYQQSRPLNFNFDVRESELTSEVEIRNWRIENLEKKLQGFSEAANYSQHTIKLLERERKRAQKAMQEYQDRFVEIKMAVGKKDPQMEDLRYAWERCIEQQDEKNKQLEGLNTVIHSEEIKESFRKYNENKAKLESQKRKMENWNGTLEQAGTALEAEKKELLCKLQEFFQQPLFNEIYQKIDPHPYMKTVSYEVGYNSEKNEPELYITTQTDGNECYQPEWFFSTAQLNTVALSSFLSRALSLVDIPIDTIVIDDPVGHFDDMNILGFADLVRSILENSRKQIVITTHDETVYQIFRRKLPPENYHSRFIDLTMK